MTIISETHKLIEQIKSNIGDLKDQDLSAVCTTIANAKKIFIAGQGRSGLIAHLFGIRLHRLGYSVNVVSEDVFSISHPLKGEGKVLVAISGSGETEDVIKYVEYK